MRGISCYEEWLSLIYSIELIMASSLYYAEKKKISELLLVA